jgi:hypothetical protein
MGKLVVLVFVLAARIGQCFEDVVGTSFCQLFCSVMPVGWNFLEVWVGFLPRGLIFDAEILQRVFLPKSFPFCSTFFPIPVIAVKRILCFR